MRNPAIVNRFTRNLRPGMRKCAGSRLARPARGLRVASGSLPFREEHVEISWHPDSPRLPRTPPRPTTRGRLESPEEISGSAVEHEQALGQVEHAIGPLEHQGARRPAHYDTHPLLAAQALQQIHARTRVFGAQRTLRLGHHEELGIPPEGPRHPEPCPVEGIEGRHGLARARLQPHASERLRRVATLRGARKAEEAIELTQPRVTGETVPEHRATLDEGSGQIDARHELTHPGDPAADEGHAADPDPSLLGNGSSGNRVEQGEALRGVDGTHHAELATYDPSTHAMHQPSVLPRHADAEELDHGVAEGSGVRTCSLDPASQRERSDR